MKWLSAMAVLAFVLMAGIASAQPVHEMGALGFHDPDAPLGVRWWLNDKVAIDAGFGVGSTEHINPDVHLSHWALDFGVPIMLKSWDQLHFIVRPGLLYESQEVITDNGPPVITDNDTMLQFGAELEAELFLERNFSVSAAQGIAIVNTDFAGGPSVSDWSTTGGNFSHVGFHVYLFGGK